MKKTLIVAAVVLSIQAFYVEARRYYIRNEAMDSFFVGVVVKDSKTIITPLITCTDPLVIVGRREQSCGKGSIRREKRYEVKFQDGYVPPPGQEPFISFKNEKSEFRLVFFDEDYAELQSDVASEIHDDPGRSEYDHLFTQSDLVTENAYDGYIRHWIAIKSYVAIYCYEMYRFPMRSVNIYDALTDNSWVQTVKEVNCGTDLPPYQKPKRHWWSKLCSCSDCDD